MFIQIPFYGWQNVPDGYVFKEEEFTGKNLLNEFYKTNGSLKKELRQKILDKRQEFYKLFKGKNK
jgi:hypothetical protein